MLHVHLSYASLVGKKHVNLDGIVVAKICGKELSVCVGVEQFPYYPMLCIFKFHLVHSAHVEIKKLLVEFSICLKKTLEVTPLWNRTIEIQQEFVVHLVGTLVDRRVIGVIHAL